VNGPEWLWGDGTNGGGRQWFAAVGGRTIAFMRLAAIELRRIAERDPDLAGELRRIADQLDADADDLERTARPGGP
jgi:hypothetical protein